MQMFDISIWDPPVSWQHFARSFVHLRCRTSTHKTVSRPIFLSQSKLSYRQTIWSGKVQNENCPALARQGLGMLTQDKGCLSEDKGLRALDACAVNRDKVAMNRCMGFCLIVGQQ